MDKETQARATEPFFTTKAVGKGTGLGLSMALGLAEQSGGQLLINSKQGQGTTIELWLPTAEVELIINQPAHAIDKGLNRAEPSDKSLKILVVDDDTLVLRNTVAMLEDLGHTVFSAATGTAALEILRQEPRLDVLLTDLVMPEISGTRLAEMVRSERPDLPILLMSGYVDLSSYTDTALPKLAKPFTQRVLAKILNEASVAPKKAVVVPFR